MFRDLSNYEFTMEEKVFVAQELLNESNLIPRSVGLLDITAAELARRHRVNASTVTKWKTKYEDNGKG